MRNSRISLTKCKGKRDWHEGVLGDCFHTWRCFFVWNARANHNTEPVPFLLRTSESTSWRKSWQDVVFCWVFSIFYWGLGHSRNIDNFRWSHRLDSKWVQSWTRSVRVRPWLPDYYRRGIRWRPSSSRRHYFRQDVLLSWWIYLSSPSLSHSSGPYLCSW